MVRAFISIEFPNDVLEEIVKIQDKIQSIDIMKGKFTERENIHLTLKFLGEIDEDKLDLVNKKLKNLKFDKFKISLKDIGVFNKNFIRIIWLGVFGEGLWGLQKAIDNNLEDYFPIESRFMGHITIARPKFVENKKELISNLKEIEFDNKEFVIDKIYLKKSELNSQGPIYSTLLEIPSN